MFKNQTIRVIIPALNEEKSIGKVIAAIPAWVDEVIVSDNGSTDSTAEMAEKAGAHVIEVPVKGYGEACLKAIDYIKNLPSPTDIVVFIDGDFSDYPEQMDRVVFPIVTENKDLVIGSRAIGKRQKGSMTIPQRAGNALATFLLRVLYGVQFTDLGPFRAIRFTSLLQIGMKDRNYGWTVEMQLKAAKYKLKTHEVAVDYKQRIGTSKVSGTVKGTFMAGYKILFTIFRYL